jgi:restriction system protein
MSVPDFQTMMLPFLTLIKDRDEHSFSELAKKLAEHYQLSEDEINDLTPTGRQTRLMNRLYWISTYFKKAKLIEPENRGTFRITDRGIDLLNQNPSRIDINTLRAYPEFLEFRNAENTEVNDTEVIVSNNDETSEEKTPDEILDDSYNTIRENLASEIIEKVKTCSPVFFERLVVELLVKMGYGGTRQDAGQALGKSGDEGIDGIIKEDRLGLDVIYLQAKRWEAIVGRPEIQKFAGALQGKRAKKGIFITTSGYSREAFDFVSHIDSRIILGLGRASIPHFLPNREVLFASDLSR